MPSLLPPAHPIDLTGNNINNRVVGEPHTLVRRNVRCLAPVHAPFFKKNVEILDAVTLVALNSTQYKVLNIVPLPSAIAGIGNEVYSVIAITDAAIGDDVILNYQTIGGEYVQSFEAALSMLETLNGDDRPTAWPNILSRPDSFTPSLHLHAVGDAIGWEYIAVALDQLRSAILLGDAVGHDQILAYIDQQTINLSALIASKHAPGSPLSNHVLNTNNPHNVTKAQVGLSLVQNYAVATPEEALAGTATNRYMTPSLVALTVDNIQSDGLGAHAGNTNNPHNVTKAQVGLGNVQNFPIASPAEVLTGVAANRYMTPVGVKSMVTADADLKLDVDEKGAVNGVAPLNASSQVPNEHLQSLVGLVSYEVDNFINGKPGVLSTLMRAIIVRPFTCPINFGSSLAYCSVPATTSFVINILKNGALAGTLTFSTGDNIGVFASVGATAVSFAIGDNLILRCATGAQDATLADIAITVFGKLV